MNRESTFKIGRDGDRITGYGTLHRDSIEQESADENSHCKYYHSSIGGHLSNGRLDEIIQIHRDRDKTIEE